MIWHFSWQQQETCLLQPLIQWAPRDLYDGHKATEARSCPLTSGMKLSTHFWHKAVHSLPARSCTLTSATKLYVHFRHEAVRSLPAWSCQLTSRMKLSAHFHPVLRLIGGAKSLVPLYAFMTRTGTSLPLHVVMTNTVILIQLFQWSNSHIFSPAPLKNFTGCSHTTYWFFCLLLNKYNTAQSVLTLNSSLYCPLLHVSALSMYAEIYLPYKGQNIGWGCSRMGSWERHLGQRRRK